MITKQITFENASGQTVTEEWCFNISKAELAKEMLMGGDDLQTRLKNIVATNDMKLIIPQFEEILRMAVGKRSADGRQFIKNREMSDDFMYSGAFFSLFMELMTDENSGATFLNNLLPADMTAEVQKDPEVRKMLADTLPEQGTDEKFPPGTPQVVKDIDALTMSEDELRAMLLGDDGAKPAPAPEPEDNRPAWLKEQREPTKDELRLMGRDELQLVYRAKGQGLLNRANAPV